MKHIIPFLEHVHIERTENEFYRFLPIGELPIRGWEIDWTDGEIETIKSTFNLPEKILMRNLGRMEELPTCEIIKIPGRQITFLTIRLKKYILNIYKYEDEWFRVRIEGQYGTMMKASVTGYIYECDQLEGLIKLIDDIITMGNYTDRNRN
jgi:hypothetical protein